MTVRDLAARGFRRNTHIPGFTGYCGLCRLYRPLDWWESPVTDDHERVGEVVVCSYCGHLDKRDEPFVAGFRKRKAAQARVVCAADARGVTAESTCATRETSIARNRGRQAGTVGRRSERAREAVQQLRESDQPR